jgi:Icc-related predicted phosphoesterase
MRLLLFSDLHADETAARRLVGLARGADILVGAGDFGNLRRDVRPCVEILATAGKPGVLVAGNNESTDELTEAASSWPSARVLHGSSAVVGGVTFYGLGGGVPITPFGSWSYDFSEEQAEALLAGCPAGCVLVSHSPPKGVLDASSSGRSLGSTAVREAVLRVAPALVVCGHIHAQAGRRMDLGTSPVVNAGPIGVPWELVC